MGLKSVLKRTLLYSAYSNIRKYFSDRWDRRSRKELNKNGSKIIVELDEILSKSNIKHFFDFGTMLGIVRDNGIIHNDADIDIGVIIDSDEDKTKIISLLNNKDIMKVRQFNIGDYGVAEESYFYKNRVRFDIHYYYGINDERYCFLFYRLPEISYSSNTEFNAVKVSLTGLAVEPYLFNNKHIFLPKDPESIISQKYGPNWRIPDSGWPYWEGPCSKKISEKGFLVLFLR